MDERVATTTPTVPGRRKAAILCVSLGKEGAAEIFKHLSNDLIEQLTVEMAKTPSVEPEQAEWVLEEFIEISMARGYIAAGGLRYAREVLERAVGVQRAAEIMSRLSAVIEVSPFDYLRTTPPDQIAAFLRNEHPQTIALVVAQLPTTALAAKVMEMFAPELQADVANRIAIMGQTSPDVVKEVAEVMEHKLETVLQREYAAAGGVRSLASILNSSNRTTERNILESLQSEDPELAEEVRRLLFVFEDVLKLDDRAIQLVLREVDSKDLALAMRGSTPEVQDKILSNMSSRGSEMLREEMEFMPPQRKRVVEEAQTKIVAIVRKLEDAGEIVIARGGDDEEDELVGEPFEFDDLVPLRTAGATHQRTLEAIVEEAREQGRLEGFDRGRREALEALAPAGVALANALVESAREHEEFLVRAEQAAAELAVALAGKILGATLEVRPQAVLDVVAGTLRRTVTRDQLVLEVSPEDFTLVRDSAERIAEQIGGVHRLDVVAERRVGRGGCIVRTEEGEVDGQIAEQLERARELVAEVLGVTAPDA